MNPVFWRNGFISHISLFSAKDWVKYFCVLYYGLCDNGKARLGFDLAIEINDGFLHTHPSDTEEDRHSKHSLTEKVRVWRTFRESNHTHNHHTEKYYINSDASICATQHNKYSCILSDSNTNLLLSLKSCSVLVIISPIEFYITVLCGLLTRL